MLGSPNTAAQDSLPLGNGSLGAAVWAANGLTAQLNRSDTLPDRRSPGWFTVPGLSRITAAADFAAHLDLYDGVLTESGAGMTAQIYLRADADMLVVDVTGADPDSTQTAQVNLWSSRNPTAAASGAVGTLAETWSDSMSGGTGSTYGSLAAVTAGGGARLRHYVGQHLAALATPGVDAQVDQHAAGVGQRVGAGAAPGAVGADERLLRQLLGAVHVPDEQPRGVQQAVGVLGHERGELGVEVPRSAAADPAKANEIVAGIAAHTREDPAMIGHALYGPPPVDDAELVRLAGYLDELERQVRNS